MSSLTNFKDDIIQSSFLVTGGAGFIGSNLAGYLLKAGAKKVRVLDNLSTGYFENIEEFISHPAFEFIEGDITQYSDCENATKDMDYVFHEAALGSVPRSIKDPAATNACNVGGFVNVLFAAHQNKVKRVIYASSSSVYGDDKNMPKVEEVTGNLLSPYAVSKKANELYAAVFERTYSLQITGLRYFNVFGPKQNINGPYAAVIPIFITHLLNQQPPTIFGNGETTRDFTFIQNVIEANVLAALNENYQVHEIYNVAYGATTSLNQLFRYIAAELDSTIDPIYSAERKGDIKDSFANINKAKGNLNYVPAVDLKTGLHETVKWYKNKVKV